MILEPLVTPVSDTDVTNALIVFEMESELRDSTIEFFIKTILDEEEDEESVKNSLVNLLNFIGIMSSEITRLQVLGVKVQKELSDRIFCHEDCYK